ncbi:protein HEG homolog 1 isoform X2 [Pseudophryne corroboree]|uniref:protein HEG homolog 1 isoform X2 n=1 Tax=Pseudophryne corroboree TaxID=495146 RepID=UPI0030814369
MMLPGFWLLLRALLLLAAALGASALPDKLWSTPGTPSPSYRAAGPPEPGGTDSSSPPGAGGTLPSAPSGSGSEVWGRDRSVHGTMTRAGPAWRAAYSLPHRAGTEPPSEPHRTKTNPEPHRTQTGSPPEPHRIQTGSPPEPHRTLANPPPEPHRTLASPPPEPHRALTGPPPEPHRALTGPPPEQHRTLAGSPPESHRTLASPPPEPHRVLTGPPPEPHRALTGSPPEPHRTQTGSPPEPHRTQTGSPPESHRILASPPPEPHRALTGPPPESHRTLVRPPPEPHRTQTGSPPEPHRTQTGSPPESHRTLASPPPEPHRTLASPPPEPHRTLASPPPEPFQTQTGPPLESHRSKTKPHRTKTDPPPEPHQTQTGSPPEPHRTQTSPPLEPHRTQTNSPPEPHRTQTDSPPEPHRTQTDSPPEPHRTQTDLPTVPHRSKTDSPSELNRTDTIPSLSADIEKYHTVPGHRGTQINFKSEPGWTELDVTWTDNQTSSGTGITQKSATRRHVNKRTPHMDTTFISTTFTRTLLSVTNDSNLPDITEIPAAYTSASDSGSTDTGSQKTGSTTKDLGNTTQELLTTAQNAGNSTEHTVSDSGSSVPSTFPLQTPSYLVATYPSSTSHHLSDSTVPFTSVPDPATNTANNSMGTDYPANNSALFLSSSSDPSSSSNSLLSTVESSFYTSTFPASSSSYFSSPPGHSNQSSSSPIPSTLVFSPHSSATQTPFKISPWSSTKPPVPLTTQSITPPLSPSPSLPPSFQTASSSARSTETGTTYLSSVSQTGEPSRAYNSSVPGVVESYHTATVPGSRTSTVMVSATTLQTEVETRMTISPYDDKRTQSVITVTDLDGPPAQPTGNVPSTTSANNLLIPSSNDSTQRTTHEPVKATASESPSLSTGDANRQVMTDRTTRMDLKTEKPRLDTTTRAKDKKLPAYTTSPPDIVIAQYPSTRATISPGGSRPTVTASLCSPSPCHNGGLCVEDSKSYRCGCPSAWHGDHCDRDVDECLSDPCPAQTVCVNSQGSFSCRCPLGYILEKGAGCVLVRTFLGHIEVPRSFLNGSNEKYSRLHVIQEQIIQILNSSFSTISGYYQSTVTNTSYSNSIVLSVQNIFSLASNVTMTDLKHNIQSYITVCQSSLESSLDCRLVLHPQLSYRAISLCNVKNPGCDNETAECADPSGVAFCQCKQGYFKYSKMDHSCRACDDGYKLENGACVRCPFGLGGFNCSNPYQLITVIIAAAGGGILLILVVALAVTCFSPDCGTRRLRGTDSILTRACQDPVTPAFIPDSTTPHLLTRRTEEGTIFSTQPRLERKLHRSRPNNGSHPRNLRTFT